MLDNNACKQLCVVYFDNTGVVVIIKTAKLYYYYKRGLLSFDETLNFLNNNQKLIKTNIFTINLRNMHREKGRYDS
jgi:hypothetical protein